MAEQHTPSQGNTSDSAETIRRYQEQIDNLQTEVERRTQELIHAERMASIGTLSAGVAHEINNPLAYVKSNLISLNGYLKPMLELARQMIELKKSDPEAAALFAKHRLIEDSEELSFIVDDIEDIVTDLLDGSERIVTIVKGLKQFSHPASNEKQSVNLNDIVRTAYELARNEIKHRGIIEFHLGDLPRVAANQSELTQVLVNLLVNAAQALPDAGGKIEVRSSASGDQVQLSVRDNGAGIDPEHLSQIFTPFFTTKPVGQGTGLGLAISHRIMQDHGGDILVDSAPGQGALFTLKFPAE